VAEAGLVGVGWSRSTKLLYNGPG